MGKAKTAPKPTAPATDETDSGSMSESMHSGMHNSHEADLHFDGEIHEPDQMAADWAPPSQLETPPARPGMVQRWIRMSLKGKSDGENMASANRDFWRPRSLTTVPEGTRSRYPAVRDKRTGGEFMINGDLVLCEMPERIFEQRRRHYREKAEGQVGNLSGNLTDRLNKDAVPGGENHGFGTPYVERRHESGSRRPMVAADK